MARKCDATIEIKRSQMKIELIVIWVSNLEQMGLLYKKYFITKARERYRSTKKKFTSYFLRLKEELRFEFMHKLDISSTINQGKEFLDCIHFAVGFKEKVDVLTNQYREYSCERTVAQRTIGGEYSERVALHTEGNQIEVMM